MTPTLPIAKESGVNLELDVEAIAAGLGAEFGSAGGGGGDGTGHGELAFSAGLSDRDPLPLVRVEPQYPPQAARRGLEGWVHVRFTITTAGSIKDAKVVKSSHSVFERAALAAVDKWKYQPQMKDGQAGRGHGGDRCCASRCRRDEHDRAATSSRLSRCAPARCCCASRCCSSASRPARRKKEQARPEDAAAAGRAEQARRREARREANELLQADKFDEALVIIDELAGRRKLDPLEIAQIHRFRGYILLLEGRAWRRCPPSSRLSLEQHALDPLAEQQMTYSLAQIYTQLGKYDDALGADQRLVRGRDRAEARRLPPEGDDPGAAAEVQGGARAGEVRGRARSQAARELVPAAGGDLQPAGGLPQRRGHPAAPDQHVAAEEAVLDAARRGAEPDRARGRRARDPAARAHREPAHRGPRVPPARATALPARDALPVREDRRGGDRAAVR